MVGRSISGIHPSCATHESPICFPDVNGALALSCVICEMSCKDVVRDPPKHALHNLEGAHRPCDALALALVGSPRKEGTLLEKLRKIQAFPAGTTVADEREAARCRRTGSRPPLSLDVAGGTRSSRIRSSRQRQPVSRLSIDGVYPLLTASRWMPPIALT